MGDHSGKLTSRAELGRPFAADYPREPKRPPTPEELEARLSPQTMAECDCPDTHACAEAGTCKWGVEDRQRKFYWDTSSEKPVVKPPNPMKLDAKKTPLRLLPVIPLYCIAKVFGFGARKYAQNSWRSKDHEAVSWMRTFDSVLNHLLLWAAGQDLDKQSGMSHLWHAGTQLMILIEHVETKSGVDDRYHNDLEHLEGLRGDD